MPLGTEVDLGPGHIVLHGDPAPPEWVQPPIFGLACFDRTVVWIGRVGPGDIVLYGDPAPPRTEHSTPTFGFYLLCQTAGWIKMLLNGTEVRFGPGRIVLDGHPAPPPHVHLKLMPLSETG